MEAAVPAHLAIFYPANRCSLSARAMSAALAGGCLLLLVVAARLQPSPSGVATHRGLGLPECQFLQKTGLPCPSCGMTTSFSWFVRGNIAASVYVQPMGAVVALICCCCVWAGFYIAVTGRPVYRLLTQTAGRYLSVPLLSIAIAAWGWKILIHLSGHDGW